MPGPLEYRRLRAPKGDGEMLFDPPLRESALRIEDNIEAARRRNFEFSGRSIHDWSREARAELLSAALEHTRKYLPDVDDPPSTDRIYIVGHQPELFHPGVWLKNFVLDQLAMRDGATAIHVLVDNDIAGDPTIAVPTGSPSGPMVEPVAFDQSTSSRPWEERRLLGAELFKNSGQRIAAMLSPLVENSLTSTLWKDVGDEVGDGDNLGQLLARLRHQLEHRWGLRTLEVPLSTLCQGRSFRWFVALVLTQLPALHERHNQALAEYRRIHKLRSASHPVPDLEHTGEVFETPFWVWTTGDPRRRKLFAQRDGEELELSDGEAMSHRVPIQAKNATGFANELSRIESIGTKIRPRALMTTMYLRVFLSDYFIHGIGGAKYDQITDRLIKEIFGFDAPAYMTATGTRLLPVERSTLSVTVNDIDRQLRDLEFHPEKHLPDDLSEDALRQTDALIAEKHALFKAGSGVDSRERHATLQRINSELLPHVASEQQRLQQQRRQAEQNVQVREVLDSREYSFCLYPEATLRPWLLDATADAS